MDSITYFNWGLNCKSDLNKLPLVPQFNTMTPTYYISHSWRLFINNWLSI